MDRPREGDPRTRARQVGWAVAAAIALVLFIFAIAFGCVRTRPMPRQTWTTAKVNRGTFAIAVQERANLNR